MNSNRTFTMFKPDAVRAGHAGAMLDQIIKGGFKVVALKYTRLTKADAEQFYAIHAERPFYGELTDFMSSGPIYAAILEKDNAVEAFRTFIGATNPAEAAEGSTHHNKTSKNSGQRITSKQQTNRDQPVARRTRRASRGHASENGESAAWRSGSPRAARAEGRSPSRAR